MLGLAHQITPKNVQQPDIPQAVEAAPEIETTQKVIWQQWVTENTEMLLAVTPKVCSVPGRENVVKMLTNAVQVVTGGNIAVFARQLGASEATVNHWFTRGRLPRFTTLLRVCFMLGCSLNEFLLEDQVVFHPRSLQILPERLHERIKRSYKDKEYVWQKLEQASLSEENPPPSVYEMGRRLECNIRTLYLRHPVACRIISARYRAYIHNRLREKEQCRRDEIKQAVLELYEKELPPTKKNIANHLSKPEYLFSPLFRNAVNEIISEIEGNNTTPKL